MAEAESNKLKFTKMHAFGNDFVIFDFRITPEKQFTESDLILTCDRNFGIGCDQLITIHKSATPDDEKGTILDRNQVSRFLINGYVLYAAGIN